MSPGKCIWTPLLLLLVASSCLASNVLVLDVFSSPSHHLWMRVLMHNLVDRGFNVTSLSCDVEKDPPQNLTYLHMEDMHEDFNVEQFLDYSFSPFMSFLILRTFFRDQFESAKRSTGFQELLNYPDDFRFDLIIFDHTAYPGFLLFAAKFGYPPVIGASAYPVVYITNEITGGPYFPTFVPNHYMDQVEESFWSRLESFITYTLSILDNQLIIYPTIDEYAREILPDAKPIKELQKSVKVSLVNYHPALNFVQPMMPNVIPVGCLQITKPNPLTTDLLVIYSRATRGVIYFSLGSNVKSEFLGKARLLEIIGAFRDLPEYTFVWKLNATGLDLDIPNNVFIRSWLPQGDILADERTLLFISHAGGLSTQESSWYGVPMLALPVILDQFPNAARLVEKGIALQLDIKAIDRGSLKSTILELVKNKKYREKAKLLSKNMQDQPELPMDRAMWWIDYVMRNEDISFLQSTKLQNMNLIVTHSIDIICALILAIIIILIIFLKICLCLVKCKRKFSLSNNVKEQNKKRK